MSDENKEEIELTPAEDNPWYKFFMVSTELDQGDRNEGPYGIKPYGWHWFWGIYFLHQEMPKFPRFNLTEIQKKLPDEHWLKNADDIDQEDLRRFGGDIPDSACQGEAVVALYKILQKHKITEAPEEIDFSNLNFKEHLNLSRFIFPIQVSFNGSNFHKAVNFYKALFFDRFYFAGTTFITNSRFTANVIADNIFTTNFEGAEFYKGAEFSNTVFCKVNFNNAKFINSGADFNNAKFIKMTSFVKTQFYKGAFFENAEFPKSPRYVNFSGANFATAGFFSNAEFFGSAIFSDAEFFGRAVFDGAKFSDKTQFHNAKFLSYTTFEESTFKFYAPKFYGAEFNDEMFWTDIKLPNFERADDEETKEKYKKRIQGNQNSYENLATKLNNQSKFRDAHFFFRQEMNCHKELAESRTSRFAFRLYELFSDYGYRIGRAFWCWVGHIVLGVLVIATMYGDMQFYKNLPCAISVSFANANPYAIFGFDSVKLAECYDMFNVQAPISFAIIKVIQTIVGVGLLFLVLLTLRIRFRLK